MIRRGPGQQLCDDAALVLGQSASVDATHDLAAYTVRLRQRAAAGDIYTTALTTGSGGETFGQVHPFPASLPSLPTLSTVAPGAQDLTLPQNSRQRLSPGAYGQVQLRQRAVAELDGGSYHFAELDLGEESRVEAFGPVEVRIAGRLSPGAKSFLGAAPGGSLTAKDFRLEVHGENGASGNLDANPEAATFGERATVRALVLAANGTLRVRRDASIRGVLFGRDVELGQDVSLVFEDGWNQAPVAHAGGPYSGNEGRPIALSAMGSTDREGGPMSFAWDLDADGVFDDATGAEPTHTFPNDGAYPVAVLVTDPFGATDTATSVANLANVSPTANADFVRVLEDSGDVTISPLANDLDWDALSILRFTQPSQGMATQVGDSLIVSLPPNFHGTLELEVTITDGVAESASAATVVVDPVPDAPVAADQSYVMMEDTELVLPAPGLLDRAEDADFDPLLVARITSVTPPMETAQVGFDGSLRLRPPVNFEGIVALRFVVTDGVLEDEAIATVTVLGQNDDPRFVSTPPSSGSVGELLTYSVSVSDPDLGDLPTLSIETAPAGATLTGNDLSWTPDSAGDFAIVLRVTDTHGASTLQTFSIHVTQPNRPPYFVSIPPRFAAVGQRLEYVLAAEDLDQGDTQTFAVDLGLLGLEVSGNTLSFVATDAQVGAHPVILRVTDAAGAFGLQSFDLEVVRVPIDPALVAPPIDLTVATSVYEANRFLIEGPNPIQTALLGAVNPRRALLLRGRALLGDETPVVGALVSVAGQADVGTTLTRLDGSFDLLVNGGGLVGVRLEKAGLISVDRSIDTVWQETYVFSDVVMTAPSAGVSIDFTAPGPKLIPSANVSGRRTTLFFGSNAAAFSANDGSVLSTLRAHVSELEAPEAFSAPLPPSSGFSFMAELQADQAEEVVFANDVYAYVDDTLNVPAGRAVPAGYYRRDLRQWVPAPDGRAIRVLGTDGSGLAEVDTDGDGLADDGADIGGVGLEERQVLASLYPSPAGVWRAPVGHFSTWAFGFSTGGPEDAVPPVKGDPISPESTEEVIERSIELTNTSFRLVYQSDRVVGFTAPRTLEIPVSGVNLPVSLDKIDAEIFVAGRRITQTFGPAADQKMDFVWDGKDAYGRSLQGGQPVRIRVSYEYPGTAYVQNPTSFLSTFAQALGRSDFVLQTSAPSKVALVQEWRGTIGGWDARSQGLGGWWLDVHHVYDPGARILYEGNGTTRKASALGLYSETVAGTGNPASTGDGGPAVDADIFNPVSVVSAPDGTVYFAEGGSGKVRKIATDGTISTILSPAAGLRTPLLQNGNAERPLSGGLIPGWTQSFGTWSLGTSNPAPFEGAQYFEATDPSTAFLTQEIDLSPYAAAIDGGSAEVALSGTLAARNGSLASASVFFLDEFDTAIDGFALGQVGSLDGWKTQSDRRFVPVGTRKAVVFLQGESNAGAPPAPPGPIFVTVPEVVACENQTYLYQVEARSGPNIAEYRLNRAPPAADILVDYEPFQSIRGGTLFWWGPTQLGSHAVEIEAIDFHGQSTIQSFDIDVVPCPAGPIITSNPVTRVRPDSRYRYAVDGIFGNVFDFANPVHPAYFLVDPSGYAWWDPTSADIGTHPITIEARMYQDLNTFTTAQTYDLVVDPDHPVPCFPKELVPSYERTDPLFARCSMVGLIGYQPTGPEFSFVQAPLGATIDPVTGIIEWDESTALPDVYTFEVAVGDRGTLTLYEPVAWPAGGPVQVMFDALSLDLVGGGSASSQPAGLAVTQDGSVLVADKGAGLVLAIRPSGNVETVAGGGLDLGDSGLATNASLDSPTGIAVGPDGAIYIADTGHHRIRRIGTDGVISTLAGNGIAGFSGDGGAASEAQLDAPKGKSVWVAPDNDKSVFVADSGMSNLRRVVLPWNGFDYAGDFEISSSNGNFAFRLDPFGKHLATRSSSTGATVYAFEYDHGGRPVGLLVGLELVLTIERDVDGRPISMGLSGVPVTLSVSPDGYLTDFLGPSRTVTIRYMPDGVVDARPLLDFVEPQPADVTSVVEFAVQLRLLDASSPDAVTIETSAGVFALGPTTGVNFAGIVSIDADADLDRDLLSTHTLVARASDGHGHIGTSSVSIRFMPSRIPHQLEVRFDQGVPAAAAESALASVNGTVAYRMRALNIFAVNFPKSVPIALAVELVLELPGVLSAHQAILYATEDVPNDPLYEKQRVAFEQIRAPEAWTITAGEPEVVVAVVDTGIDPFHPDVAGNLWINRGERDEVDNTTGLPGPDGFADPGFNRSKNCGAVPTSPRVDAFEDDPTCANFDGIADVDLHNPGISASEDVNGNGRFDPVAAGPPLFGDIDHIDNDCNDKIDDVIGWDFCPGGECDDDRGDDGLRLLADEVGHGTAVAGLIAATTDNGVGVASTARNVRIMAVRSSAGSQIEAVIAKAATCYAVDNGARVINASFGGYHEPEIDESSAIDAAEHAGVLVVASAGNGLDVARICLQQSNILLRIACVLIGGQLQELLNIALPFPLEANARLGVSTDIVTHIPSGLPNSNVISVAALDATGETLTPSSNHGAISVDVAAPGDLSTVFTTFPTQTLFAGAMARLQRQCKLESGEEKYCKFQGTSAAAAYVSGVAALMLSVAPGLSPTSVREILVDTATPVSETPLAVTLTEIMYSDVEALRARLAERYADPAEVDEAVNNTIPQFIGGFTDPRRLVGGRIDALAAVSAARRRKPRTMLLDDSSLLLPATLTDSYARAIVGPFTAGSPGRADIFLPARDNRQSRLLSGPRTLLTRFIDASEVLPSMPLDTSAALTSDFNGDGLLDLVLVNGTDPGHFAQADSLWLSQRLPNSGPFGALYEDFSVQSGLGADATIGVGAAAGFLFPGAGSGVDFYVAVPALGTPDVMWIHEGFIDVLGSSVPTFTRTEVSGNPLDSSLGVTIGELIDLDPTQPGWDIFLASGDQSDGDVLLVNQGPSCLVSPFSAGACFQPLAGFPDIRRTSNAVAVGDFDGDGDTDIFVLEAGSSDTLYVNQVTFFTEEAGTRIPAPQGGGSDVDAVDLNQDGWLDLLVSGSGGLRRVLLNRGPSAPGTFVDASSAWVPEGLPAMSHLAVSDLDFDGDLDVVLTGDLGNVRVLVNASMESRP
ncbi:MAG: S8 family serine peptidase [Deltaproteobacteria bacterium]|nr:S8 family serine peptidase [Deltaproteobacteria bacterium]